MSGDGVVPDRSGRGARRPVLGPAERRFLVPLAVVGTLLLVSGVVVGFLLAGEDPVRAQLVGTPLAPTAAGEVRITEEPEGLEVRLDLRGLGPAEEGFYYQAWVSDGEGQVPMGTFRLDGEDASVELSAGVEGGQGRTVTVTLDPVGEASWDADRVVLETPRRD